MDKKFVTVYWLIPARPYRELFREIIHILAEELDAPRFEPHLTFFATPKNRQSPAKILRHLKAAPVRLRVHGIGYSFKFTKTLYVRFAPAKSLDRLIVDLAGAAKPVRDPHMSLIYKKLPANTKKELASTIKLPFPGILFDSIRAVHCASPTETRADVEAWRVIATKSLR